MTIVQESLLNRLGRADVCCSECGLRYGKYSVGCSSVWNGTCDVCGEDKPITEVRDYGYFQRGINELKERIKEQSLEVANYTKCQEEIASQETDNHPITPSQELVEKWAIKSPIQHSDETWAYELFIADQAARWGADQELEACCQEVHDWYGNGSRLRAARRPKPPSLKEQAFELVDRIEKAESVWAMSELDIIRRALEELPD